MILASERWYADSLSCAKATHPEAYGIDCGASRFPRAFRAAPGCPGVTNQRNGRSVGVMLVARVVCSLTLFAGAVGACASDSAQPVEWAAATATPDTHAEWVQSARQSARWARAHLPGRTERQAQQAAKQRGLRFRVLKRDGRNLPRRSDRRLDRVNAVVRSNRVTQVAGVF
jgi:hypothetical protein